MRDKLRIQAFADEGAASVTVYVHAVVNGYVNSESCDIFIACTTLRYNQVCNFLSPLQQGFSSALSSHTSEMSKFIVPCVTSIDWVLRKRKETHRWEPYKSIF